MIPRQILATSVTPAGDPITLAREGVALVVRVRNEVLMSSRMHGSEETLAEVGCAGLADRRRARVLVGGLGMGFTLRATLDRLAPDAEVVVAELIGALVEWNRGGPLAELAGHPLEDRRVRVEVGDVIDTLAPGAFDAILLDVDNGPEALTVPGNARLYRGRGLERCAAALRPGGALVVWSASESAGFARALERAGLGAETVRARARGDSKKGPRHVLYVGRAQARPQARTR